MQLYNTLSRELEDVTATRPPHLGFYACGPTVYDYAHIGHLRKFIMDDVLVRALKRAGFEVQHVQNITDVGHLASDADTGEDKLEKGAKKYGKSVWDVAHEFEDYFWYSMNLVNVRRPDVAPRATDHIPEQLAMVQELERRGYTYVIEDDGVYFDTSKLDDYGKLAQLDVDNLMAGARVEQVTGKRSPTDFALWKFERPGENREMVWESPWHPRSFPGWHIECSAMSMKYLGEQFEIHTGGIDHIPVHHTNEIAQSEAATGKKPFVRLWVHHNFLSVEGEKMSKSLGNFYTVDDVMSRGYEPMALRLLFLTSHYRSELNFTWDNAAAMHKNYLRLLEQMSQLKQESSRTVLSEDKMAKIDEYRQRFFGHLEHDLHTPEALAVVWEVVKSNIPGPDKYDLLLEFDEVFGLDLQHADERLAQWRQSSQLRVEQLPQEIQALLEERQLVRDAKDWVRSDELRVQLKTLGYEVTDDRDKGQLVFPAL